MPRIKIKKFEHSVLRVGEEGFSKLHFYQLVRLNEKHNNKYFFVGNNCIYFTQYVGVIQAGNLTLEVLPKADVNGDDAYKWQRAFIEMLRESRLLQINSPSYADLKFSNISLIELFYETFLFEVEKLLRLGLVKKYRLIENNGNVFKGRLLFSKNLKYNSFHSERFYIQQQVYNKNNIYNQILKAALRILLKIIPNNALLDRVKNLLVELEYINDVKITPKYFDNLVFDRKSSAYQRAILFSKMILLNYSPDIVGGQFNTLSLLFDMNEVFENYIFNIIKKAASSSNNLDINLKKQSSKKFWNERKIRPDIIIELNSLKGAERIIVDTKWKILKQPLPSDTDLKQIYSYNLHFGARKSYLVYPKVFYSEKYFGNFYHSEALNDEFKDHQCNLYFVDMFDGKFIKKNLGRIILKDLIETFN